VTRLPDDTPRNLARLAACFVACLAGFGFCVGCGDDVLPAPGNSGEVCTQPDDADCESHTGGELDP
jgi:hypothetical protein